MMTTEIEDAGGIGTVANAASGVHRTTLSTFTDAALSVSSVFIAMGLQIFHLQVTTGRTPDTSSSPPLPDIIFDLRYIDNYRGNYVNYCLFTQVISCVLLMIFSLNTMAQRYAVLTRFSLCWSVALVGRTITMSMTSLPATNNQCQDLRMYRINSIKANMWLLFTSLGGSGTHCGDLLYSGHMTLITVSFVALVTYSQYRLVRLSACMLTSFSGFCMVLARHHYAMDVFLAFVITLLIWKITPERFTLVHLTPWEPNESLTVTTPS